MSIHRSKILPHIDIRLSTELIRKTTTCFQSAGFSSLSIAMIVTGQTRQTFCKTGAESPFLVRESATTSSPPIAPPIRSETLTTTFFADVGMDTGEDRRTTTGRWKLKIQRDNGKLNKAGFDTLHQCRGRSQFKNVTDGGTDRRANRHGKV